MRTTVIFGSPRRGSNSAKLAEAVVGGLSDRRNEVSRFVLNDLKIRPCQSCYGCKTKSQECVLKDDLTEVLAAAAGADLVVVATPVYIGDVSAQLKLFLDRTYSWIQPGEKRGDYSSRVAPGKRLVLVVTQGEPDREIYRGRVESYEAYFRRHGFEVRTLLGAGLHTEDVAAANPELLEAAAALAKDL